MPDYNTIVDDAVGYWPLQETSGTTAADSTGNGHNGTLTGLNFANDSVTGPRSWLPNALEASGTSLQRVMINDHASLRGGRDFSIGCWVKRVPELAGFYVLLGKGTATSNRDYILYWQQPNDEISFATVQGGNGITLVDAQDTNEWVFVVATFANASKTAKLYVNGVQEQTGVSSFSSAVTTGDVNFFGPPSNQVDNSNGRQGSLAGVGFWDQVLTPEEITTLYTGPSTSENFYSEVDGLDLELGKTYS